MEKEIVKNAAYLFLQYGYKSVTMDDLAEHMGISKKTIYTYFNDKISLIRSSVWYIFEEVKTKIIGVQESMDNPIEALYEIKKLPLKFWEIKTNLLNTNCKNITQVFIVK